MTWRVLWSVAGGHECPPFDSVVGTGFVVCLLLCFCGVSPGWPGLGATGLGVCCRPCWGLRTLRACESANETGLYLPSSRLAYPPTSQAPEAPTATPSAQTLEDPTSPATGTDSSDAGHLICLSSTVDGLEWREEILRRFGEVHNCMLCFWTPQHTRHDISSRLGYSRTNARGSLHSHSNRKKMHWRSATTSGSGRLGESEANIEIHHGRYIGIDPGDDVEKLLVWVPQLQVKMRDGGRAIEFSDVTQFLYSQWRVALDDEAMLDVKVQAGQWSLVPSQHSWLCCIARSPIGARSG